MTAKIELNDDLLEEVAGGARAEDASAAVKESVELKSKKRRDPRTGLLVDAEEESIAAARAAWSGFFF